MGLKRGSLRAGVVMTNKSEELGGKYEWEFGQQVKEVVQME